METRIKYIKTAKNGWLYAVQTKRWIFWKTIETYASFEGADRFLNRIKEIDEFNNKAKSLNEIVYEGWAVRNISKRTGSFGHLEIFKSYPTKVNDDGYVLWKNDYGSALSDIQIKCDKLFGKECLEPMKLRITIEQIEEG